MMKQFLFGFFALVMLSSCASNKKTPTSYDKILQSTDAKVLINKANEYYEKGKYENAVAVYERAEEFTQNQEQTIHVLLRIAESNFKLENYILASNDYNKFYINYPKSAYAEEAYYRAALSMYMQSPSYDRDQGNTRNAINTLKSFIATFPNSKNVENASGYIEELETKLQKKSFEIAKTYYKTGKYRSSAKAFENILQESPNSMFKEDIMFFVLKSNFQYAINSVEEKQPLRLRNALTSYKDLSKSFPEGKYAKEAKNLSQRIESKLKLSLK